MILLKFQTEFAKPNKRSATAFRDSEQKILLKDIQNDNMNRNRPVMLTFTPTYDKGTG